MAIERKTARSSQKAAGFWRSTLEVVAICGGLIVTLAAAVGKITLTLRDEFLGGAGIVEHTISGILEVGSIVLIFSFLIFVIEILILTLIFSISFINNYIEKKSISKKWRDLRRISSVKKRDRWIHVVIYQAFNFFGVMCLFVVPITTSVAFISIYWADKLEDDAESKADCFTIFTKDRLITGAIVGANNDRITVMESPFLFRNVNKNEIISAFGICSSKDIKP